MARLPRAVLPGSPHLILLRARSGQPVCTDASDRETYLAALRDAAAESRVAIHAYGLRDDEVRLLATPHTVEGLAATIQATGRRYVRAYNLIHGRSGSPWEGRFRSAVVDPSTHFFACLRFVELDAPESDPAMLPPLPWSSARHHAGLAHSPLVTEHPAFWTLGNTPFEREAAWRRTLGETPDPGELANILQAAWTGWVIGSPAFALAVQDQTGRRTARLSAGRPRKSTSPAGIDMTPIK